MNFNLAVILQETAAASPDRAAVVYEGVQLSYAELDALSSRLAAGLESAGVGPGDLVGLQLPNIPQFLIAYFGILKAGAVVVPLNVMLKPPEIAFHLSDSGVKLLITWDAILGDAVKGAGAAGVNTVYAVGHAAQAAGPAEPVSVLPFEHLLAVPADGYLLAPRALTDTAVVVYTSGTTGRPKGAMLTHIQLYMNADIPGRLFGEVMAVVTVRDGAAVTEAKLHAYCQERIAAYKYPRRFEFPDQLPKNSLGKVLKDELLPPEFQRAAAKRAGVGRPDVQRAAV